MKSTLPIIKSGGSGLTRSQLLDQAGIAPLPSSLGYDRRSRRQDLGQHVLNVKREVGTLKWLDESGGIEQSVQLDHEVRLGSASACDIRVQGSGVNPIHLVFYAVRTSSPFALVCMHDLSKSGYILNGERYHRQKRYKLGERSFGARIVVLRDQDQIQIPATSKVLTYCHNFTSYPLEPFFNEAIGDYTLFRDSAAPSDYVETNMWRIHHHPLGEGTFGVVNIATHRQFAVQAACKTIDSRMDNWRERVRQEVINVKALDHPNVLRLLDQVNVKDASGGKAHIMFELAAGGDLFSYLEAYGSPRGLSEDEAKFLGWQLVKGIEHIHSKGVAHRDIKKENILLYTRTSFPRLMIGDFGASISLAAITQTVPRSFNSGSVTREIQLEGTINHLPPERLRALGRKVGTAGLCESLHGSQRRTAIAQSWFADELQLDNWALGIVIHEMVAGQHPYDRTQQEKEPLFLPSSDSTYNSGSTIKSKRRFADLDVDRESDHGSRKGSSWAEFRNANTYRTLGVKATPETAEAERMMDDIIVFRVSGIYMGLSTCCLRVRMVKLTDLHRIWIDDSGNLLTGGMSSPPIDDRSSGQNMVAGLMSYRAERRMSISQAMAHPWFSSHEAELDELYREIVVQSTR